VLEYLKQENAYTAAVLQPQEELQSTLFSEMKARIKETDLSVPVRIGDYFYYTRTEKDRQYPLYARKKDSLRLLKSFCWI
jgi:oligopeptidase B